MKNINPVITPVALSVTGLASDESINSCSQKKRGATRLSQRSPQLGREKRGLTRFCQRKQLTDCLEILAQTGIQGDEAIFVLSNLGGEA